jgi:flavin-dependent dehydrogenase
MSNDGLRGGLMAEYDVVVVGAGPGGCLAAKTAAEKGLKTLVIERGNETADKIYSGCGLFAKMFRDFPFTKEVKNLPKTRVSRTFSFRVLEPSPSYKTVLNVMVSPSKRLYEEGRELMTCNVYMKEFVGFLANSAKKAGAEFRMATLVSDLLRKDGKIAGVRTDKGEEIWSDVVIAADGVLSLMARKAGLRAKWKPEEVANICSITFSAPQEKMDEFTEECSTFLWVIPTIGGWYQVCCKDGFHIGGLGYPTGLISKRIEMKTRLVTDYLKIFEAPPVKSMLRRLEAKPVEWSMHPLTWIDEMPSNIYTDGLMLVGDAAGFPEPFLASGVYEAMYSGKLAAEVAAEAVEKGDTSKHFLRRYYERVLASPIGKQFELGKEVRTLFGLFFTDEKFFELVTDLLNFGWIGMSNLAYPYVVSLRKVVPALLDNIPTLTSILRLFSSALITSTSESLSNIVKIIAPLLGGE